jgi:leucyl/phenylalanyl-tRNA--protein transferase
VPVEPAPSRWSFPPLIGAEPEGPVAVGADLEPATLLEAYRNGMFPMPLGRRNRIGWFSPDPRAILPLDGLKVSRSLRRSAARMQVTVNQSFVEVMRACADPSRPHGWISDEFVDAYLRLNELGWAHSVETRIDGELVGGLYGVSIGSFFAGESMFHRATDASKVALVHLVDLMRSVPRARLDVQWSTPHLQRLGAIEISRSAYLELLAGATREPPLALH